MATLRDVARLSGVSTATVSNVLNARHDRVSAETRDKVMAAVRSLRYRPTALEKNQKAILTQNLGVLVTDLTRNPLTRHGYFRLTLDGIMEAAMFRGWSVTIFAEKMWDDLGLAIRRSYDGRCDGLIVIAPSRDNESVPVLQQRGIPLVSIGATATLPGISSVDVDNEAIGRSVARHLFELRHRRFAFLGTSIQVVGATEREESFRRTLAEDGIPQRDIATYWLKTSGRTADDIAEEFVRMGSARPTGVFGWHDAAAAEAVAAFVRAGLRVPRDISVVGVDDSPEAQMCNPPLTSIPQPLHAIGMRAANLLLDRLGDEPHPDEIVRFPTDLIPRASTGPAPVLADLTHT